MTTNTSSTLRLIIFSCSLAFVSDTISQSTAINMLRIVKAPRIRKMRRDHPMYCSVLKAVRMITKVSSKTRTCINVRYDLHNLPKSSSHDNPSISSAPAIASCCLAHDVKTMLKTYIKPTINKNVELTERIAAINAVTIVPNSGAIRKILEIRISRSRRKAEKELKSAPSKNCNTHVSNTIMPTSKASNQFHLQLFASVKNSPGFLWAQIRTTNSIKNKPQNECSPTVNTMSGIGDLELFQSRSNPIQAAFNTIITNAPFIKDGLIANLAAKLDCGLRMTLSEVTIDSRTGRCRELFVELGLRARFGLSLPWLSTVTTSGGGSTRLANG
mmetsp:Transcript_124638/g.285504  ORF Transcript_124638/g.285504 Transcript_124638/m.285504 type:complete len:329 (-) Transcript_124638:121-1107(-)